MIVENTNEAGKILVIGATGILTAETISVFNQYLESVALILTIGGILWRMFKSKKT